MPSFACFRWLYLCTPHTLKLLNQVCPMCMYGWEVIGTEKQNFEHNCSYSPVLAFILGAQKNHLIKMVNSGTHGKCFGGKLGKRIFNCPLLSRGLFDKLLHLTVKKLMTTVYFQNF